MKKIQFALFAIAILFLNLACEKNQIYTDPTVQLKFSTDTLSFDTIFTDIGSTTRAIKIYNTYNRPLQISNIRLARNNSSTFRLNIDGEAGNTARNVEIAAHDSLYIFVELTIDPNQENAPMLIQDSIVFETNGNQQDLDLIAWGQNVHLIDGEVIKSQTWINDKPYLVINSMLVDTLETLRIEAGVQVHFARNSKLYVLGTLHAEGTSDEKIVFQGNRLEHIYDDAPGQWSGIHLLNGSRHNYLNHTIIKNANIGIQLDTLADLAVPTLRIHNSRIEHMTTFGILAQASTMLATNCVIGDCGYYSLVLTLGGAYELSHCTIGNYWAYSNRLTPAVLLQNYYIDVDNRLHIRNLEKANFNNCILYGNRETELLLDATEGGLFNYQFDHCLIKIQEDFETSPDKFTACIFNKYPKFISSQEYDYQLDTISPAKDAGSSEVVNTLKNWLEFDLNGTSRLLDDAPDLGAFERVE